jgi:signal transduction histidine kinase
MASLATMRGGERRAVPPAVVLALMLAGALAAGGAATWTALQQPWLGLILRAASAPADPPRIAAAQGPAAGVPLGASLVALRAADGASLALRSDDLVPEPDAVYASYPRWSAFFARQADLAALLHQPRVTAVLGDGRSYEIRPQPRRPLATLPPLFWFQLLCGASSLIVGGAIRAFRAEHAAARHCFLAGLFAMPMTMAAAVYSTRELALPEALFRGLSALNHLSAMLCCAAFAAVLWWHPRPLGGSAPVVGAYLLAAALWVIETAQWSPAGPASANLFIAAGYGLALLFSVLQWWRVRGDPLARAALQWFLLSWLLGGGALVFLIALPSLAGIGSGRLQSYAFGFLLFLQLGLALGIARYRLFDLETWWLRAVMLVFGSFAVLLFDALFVLAFGLDSAAALMLALILAGWLYFPFRQWAMSRLFTGARRLRLDDVPALLRDVLARDYEAGELLPEALRRLYAPLALRPLAQAQDEVGIAEHGLALRVPGIGTFPAWEARFPGQGRRLFTRRDAQVASAVRAVLERIAAYQTALERGIEQERARVAQDLHDDLGARLLTLLHRSEGETAQTLRDALASLRLTVYGLGARPQPLADCLANWRAEAAERCEAHGVSLQWRESAPLPACVLSATQQLNLARVLREAVSNALRHAQPRRIAVGVAVRAEQLELTVTDDGRAPPPAQWHSGLGLRGMDSRLQRLGGSLMLAAVEGGGTQVTARIPLPPI